ncbi:MAG: hypothetical protein AAGB32_02960, partial [Pseudomonadota bacterium]
MEKIALIFLVVVLIVGAIFFTPSKNQKEEYMIQIRGMDLTGAPRQIPQSLDNNLSVVIFAFKEEQQQIVNQWLPFVTALQRHNADTEFYQVIFYDISDSDTVYWSDDAIRKGILKKDSEDHTITVFMDDDRLLRTLN